MSGLRLRTVSPVASLNRGPAGAKRSFARGPEAVPGLVTQLARAHLRCGEWDRVRAVPGLVHLEWHPHIASASLGSVPSRAGERPGQLGVAAGRGVTSGSEHVPGRFEDEVPDGEDRRYADRAEEGTNKREQQVAREDAESDHDDAERGQGVEA